MKVEDFQRNRFIRNFSRDKSLIFATTGIMAALSLVYVLTLYKPAFKSEAKVWIKDTSTKNYVTDSTGQEPGYLSPLTQAGNPVMTQVEILTSKEMANYLSQYVAQNQPKSKWAKTLNGMPYTEDIIKVKTEPNTDVLQVQLQWDDPVFSQRMLSAVLKRLEETNLEINRHIYSQKRAYIDDRLHDIESKLALVRGRIKQFQAGNMSVDLTSQTQELVRLKTQLTAQLEAVNASRRNSAGNANALQHQLKLSPSEALQAVALGSGNENLVKMRADLSLLQQQYAKDSVKLAPTNPTMMAAKRQIEALQDLVQQEVQQTVGKGNKANLMIYDTVRSQLVQDLASQKARAEGLGSEANSLVAAIHRVDSALREIPKNQLTLTELQEEEKTLSLAFDELRKKQIEAQIKEAEAPSNVFVVDSPNVPDRASFPTGLHLILLSMVFGSALGFGISCYKTQKQDLCEGVAQITEATGAPIIGRVPWHEDVDLARARQDDSLFAMNDRACKQIISSLKLAGLRPGAQSVAFTSSSESKKSASGVYHLAQCLRRVGQSVVLIETDSHVNKKLSVAGEVATDVALVEAIQAIDTKVRNGQVVYPQEVLDVLMPDAKGVFHVGIGKHAESPYDVFASRGFQTFLKVLKEHFDWVFIDAPNAALAPEFTIIAHACDGVVLFVEKQVTTSTLEILADQIRASQSRFIGSIIRESIVEEQSPSNRNNRNGGMKHRASRNGNRHLTALTEPQKVPMARVELLGAKIDALTMDETVQRIVSTIEDRSSIQHVVVNVAKLIHMRRDAGLRNIVNEADLVNADGAGIVWGAKLLGVPIPERVAGIDLMQRLVEESNQRGYRIYFLGAEESVVQEVIARYRAKFPKLMICGYHHGYFSPEQAPSVVRNIKKARPDILFVAMSSPKKERFVAQHKADLNIPFIMGVGGSFDVVAGKVKRAPSWMQQCGLEWMYRFIQEPSRMWKRYLYTNVAFGFLIAGQAVSRRLRSAHG